jgi:hypothetical protein
MSTLGLIIDVTSALCGQITDHDFNAITEINGNLFGTNELGVFQLDDGDKFNGADIAAFFELVKTDISLSHDKHIRNLFVGMSGAGAVNFYVAFDDGDFTLLRHDVSKPGYHNARVVGNMEDFGRYFTLKVANHAGADFSISSIELLPILMNRRDR